MHNTPLSTLIINSKASIFIALRLFRNRYCNSEDLAIFQASREEGEGKKGGKGGEGKEGRGEIPFVNRFCGRRNILSPRFQIDK